MGRAVARANRWLRKPINNLFALTTLALYALVLTVYGFAPGSSPSPNYTFDGAGMIRCLHEQGVASLFEWCHATGAPIGDPFLMGLPQAYAGWLASYLPGVDAWDASKLSQCAFLALSLWGGYVVARRWVSSRWLALLAPGLYLLTPSMPFLNGFGYTFIGYAMLPAYLAAGLFVIDGFERGGRALPALGSLMLALVMVFTDGYSFFGGFLILGVLGAARALRPSRSPAGARWAFVALMLSGGVAALSYQYYVPNEAYQQVLPGLGVFRFLGLDVATLFIPVNSLWYARLLGLHVTTPDLWGDGTNVQANYIGVSTLLLVAWLLLRGRRRLDRSVQIEVGAILVAGAIGLVLAFGPSLKFDDATQAITPGWDVPSSMTTMNLPTSWIFAHVPGISEMRATYRWFLVTRLAAVLAAVVSLDTVWRPRKRSSFRDSSRVGALRSRRDMRTRSGVPVLTSFAVVMMTMLLVVETIVNIPGQLDARALSAQKVDLIRGGIVAESSRLIHPGEVVLALPTSNDVLASVLAPMSGARIYNVSGDKNNRLSRSRWPQSITNAANSYSTGAAADAICAALRSDADVVMLPYMSLFYGALLTGDRSKEDSELRSRAHLLAQDDRFSAVSGTWMTLLRSRNGACG